MTAFCLMFWQYFSPGAHFALENLDLLLVLIEDCTIFDAEEEPWKMRNVTPDTLPTV